MKEMLKNADERIRRYGEIKAQIERLKAEAEGIEVEFLKAMEDDLKDSKYKSVEYSDGRGNKVTLTEADSLKIVYPSYLEEIFGKAYDDVVSMEIKYKLNAAASRMLTAIYNGEYLSGGSVPELVNTLGLDEKTSKALLKKLKGKSFDTDMKNLIKLGGLNEEEAKENAYLVSEICAWDEFMKLMQLNDKTDEKDIAEMLRRIDGAVTVEQTAKIKITLADTE